MADPARWEERYRGGDLPWDRGSADTFLTEFVESGEVAPGKALEVGAGTGTNAVWLAEHGFDVTAVDISATAVANAKSRAAEAGVDCTFVELDFLHEPPPGGPFRFAFDRGCFHSFDSAEEQRAFAAQVAAALEPGGTWLSLVGSTDGPPREMGPPRRSARDIAAALEEDFEIVSLTSAWFDSKDEAPARMWRVVARRRTAPAVPSTKRG